MRLIALANQNVEHVIPAEIYSHSSAIQIMDIEVVPIKENYLGMSYGVWAGIWDNWLMSENPDTNVRKDILFLRGNLDYKPVASHRYAPRYMSPSSGLMFTAKDMIFANTAIIIPALTARYSLGDVYDGRTIKDELSLREAVNRDTDESLNVYATIKNLRNGGELSSIVDDLNDFRIESPMYKLKVHPRGKLIKTSETMSDPGIFYSVIGGFFLIIKSLPKGRYRIRFGGEGRGRYSTHSIYDISVHSTRTNRIQDTSKAAVRFS
jgi:hypothetical protein